MLVVAPPGQCTILALSMPDELVFVSIGSPRSCHLSVLHGSLPGLLAVPWPLETLEAPSAGAATCNGVNTSPSLSPSAAVQMLFLLSCCHTTVTEI